MSELSERLASARERAGATGLTEAAAVAEEARRVHALREEARLSLEASVFDFVAEADRSSKRFFFGRRIKDPNDYRRSAVEFGGWIGDGWPLGYSNTYDNADAWLGWGLVLRDGRVLAIHNLEVKEMPFGFNRPKRRKRGEMFQEGQLWNAPDEVYSTPAICILSNLDAQDVDLMPVLVNGDLMDDHGNSLVDLMAMYLL
jgi:hypothetical protein